METDNKADIKLRVEAAQQLRDSLENYVTGAIYPAFLKKLMPIFISLLKGAPVFVSTSAEQVCRAFKSYGISLTGRQKLRNCVLEIFHRLPTNPPEAFEPYAEEVVDLLISLVRIDNEENAQLCVKTIMDIMRHQTKVLQDKVQPFLALIQELFDQMEAVVRDQLDNAPPGPATPGSSQHQNSPRPGSPVASAVTELGADPQQQTRPLLKECSPLKFCKSVPSSWSRSFSAIAIMYLLMSSSSYPSSRIY